jgi:hypothetical protein
MKTLKNRFRLIAAIFLVHFSAVSLFSAKLLVGPTQTYKSPSAVSSIVKPGDIVEIDSGTYAGETTTWQVSNLTLRGKSKFAHLVAPSTISNGKAIWVVQGNNTVIENIEFSNASVPDQNGAGIRIEGGNITIRNCFFHDNEDGILGGSGSQCNVTIENSEFGHNGYGDGYSHNMYIGNAASLTLKFCYSHHAKIGHTVKSRAQTNYILYNRIMDEADGTASYEIDLPNGGTSYIIGNIVQQGPLTDNPTIIAYGEEGLSNTGKDLYVINNTIVNDRSSGTFISIASGASRAKIGNNLFVGSGTLISGPADTFTNLSTNTPGFANRASYDYRPLATAPGINKGSDPGSAGTFSLLPVYQYDYDCSGSTRVSDGVIDIGAYEFKNSSVVPVREIFSGVVRPTRSSLSTGICDLLGRSVGNRQTCSFRTIPAGRLVSASGAINIRNR